MAVLTLLLGVITGQAAGESDVLALRASKPEVTDVAPGTSLTLPFVATNPGTKALTVTGQIVLAPGWRAVTGDGEFTIAPGGRAMRLVVVTVDREAPPATQQLTYRLVDPDGKLLTEAQVRIGVKPLIAVQMQLQTAPVWVVAGDQYSAVFSAVNSGNAAVDLDFVVTSSPRLKYLASIEHASLMPGATSEIEVTVTTPARPPDAFSHLLAVHARSAGSETALASARATVDVVPRSAGQIARFQVVPGRLTTVLGEDDDEPVAQLGLNLDGPLDDKGDWQVDLVAVENLGDAYLRRDEVGLTLAGPSVEFALGDRTFYLSRLTQDAIPARGAGLKWHGDRLSLTGFLAEPETRGGARAGLRAAFEPLAGTELASAYLYKEDPTEPAADVFSLGLTQQLGKVGQIESELAYSNSDDGSNDSAIRLALESGRGAPFTYWLSWLRAEPEFAGSRDDFQSWNGGVRKTWTDLELAAYFAHWQQNLDHDPSIGSAPQTGQYQLELRRRWTPWTVKLGAERLTREDGLAAMPDVAKTDLARVTVDWRREHLSLQSTGWLGSRHSDSDNQQGLVRGVLVQGRYDVRDNFHLSAYSEVGHQRFAYNFAEQWRIGAAAGLSLRRLQTGLEYDHITGDGAAVHRLGSYLNWQVKPGHHLRLTARTVRSATSDAIDTALLTYTVAFAAPVGVRRGRGTVKGRVYDLSTADQPPLAKTVVRLGNQTVVSDRNGKFAVYGLAPGQYNLWPSQPTLSAGMIPAQPMPQTVTVSKGRTTEHDIPIVRSGSLAIEAINFEPADGSYFLAAGQTTKPNRPAGPGVGLRVELSNGPHRLSLVTDAAGKARAVSVVPGHWEIRLEPGQLPRQRQPEVEVLEIDIEPGSEELVHLNIVPKYRRLMMIE